MVPWNYIVDETRSLHSWHYAGTVYQYVENILPSARVDLWDGVPPLILCESRSLAGVLRDIAKTYLSPIAATNGQAGGFLRTDVGPLIRGVGGPVSVPYFGDYDLSGGHIEENTRRVLEEYGEVRWDRLAITDVQVRERGLTKVEKKDHRFKPARAFPAVETEALQQQEIQRLLREALYALVALPLNEARVIEERQRVPVREALAALEGSNGGGGLSGPTACVLQPFRLFPYHSEAPRLGTVLGTHESFTKVRPFEH